MPTSCSAARARRPTASAGGRATLGMERLAACQHLDELSDAPGPSVGALRRFDPVQDGVAVLAAELPEHGVCAWVGAQCSCEVGRDLDALASRVRGVPATV